MEQLVAFEEAERDVGVADVDGEEHDAALSHAAEAPLRPFASTEIGPGAPRPIVPSPAHRRSLSAFDLGGHAFDLAGYAFAPGGYAFVPGGYAFALGLCASDLAIDAFDLRVYASDLAVYASDLAVYASDLGVYALP